MRAFGGWASADISLEVMVVKRVLHAPGARSTDVLVDLQSVPEVRGGLGRVLVEEAAADSFQRACLLKRRANLAGDDERLTVVAAGFLGC
jgi:hypothetical protein